MQWCDQIHNRIVCDFYTELPHDHIRSEKFLWGRNFWDFHNQTPSCENFLLWKFLAPKMFSWHVEKVKHIAVQPCIQRHRIDLTLSKKHQPNCRKDFWKTTNDQLAFHFTAIANRSSEIKIACSLGMAVYRQQLHTHLDKYGSLLQSFQCCTVSFNWNLCNFDIFK